MFQACMFLVCACSRRACFLSVHVPCNVPGVHVPGVHVPGVHVPCL